MNFLNPLLLLAIAAVAVPIIVHLINMHRPKKIRFSTLAFFEELKKSTIRRIRIKEYLLLALRAGAILLLALALARPFLPPSFGGSDDPSRAIVFLIDNSPSMNRVGAGGPLIDRAKELARGLVEQSSGNDRFLVATTNGTLRPGTLVNGLRATELIGEVEAENRGNFINEALDGVVRQLEESAVPGATIYLLSDGQQSQFEKLREYDPGEQMAGSLYLQPVLLGESNQQNVSIASVTLQGQMINLGSPAVLDVEVRNEGTNAVSNQYLSLEVEGEIKGQYEFDLAEGASRTFSFEMIPEQTGDNAGAVILEGDEVTFDNTHHFVVRVPEERSVLVVREEEDPSGEYASYLSPALEAARMTDTQLEISEQVPGQTDPSDWQGADVLVFDGLTTVPEYWFEDLQRFVQQGNGLLFFPSEQGSVENYNAFFQRFNGGSYGDVSGTYASFEPVGQMADLEEGHPVMNDLFDKEEEEIIRIDLPELFYYYRYDQPSNTGSYVLLETENGEPLWTEQRFGDGSLFISAFGTDPGWSTFPVNPLFSPLYYRSVLYAASGEQGGIMGHTLGEPFDRQVDLSGTDIGLDLNGQEARPSVENLAEGVRVSYEGREWSPGVLEISSGDQTRKIAVNQHIMESQSATLDSQMLRDLLDGPISVADAISAGNLGSGELNRELESATFSREIWNWFVWVAFMLLIAETLVARLYKAETVS